jgi:hypothetical protein
MHSCSKLFTWKISKPAISRTPMNVALLEGRSSALLMRPPWHRRISRTEFCPKTRAHQVLVAWCVLASPIRGQPLSGVGERLWKILRQASPGGGMPSLPATATRNVLGDSSDQNLFRYSQCAKLRRRCGRGRIARRDQNQPHQGPPTTRVVSKHVFGVGSHGKPPAVAILPDRPHRQCGDLICSG